MQEVRWRTRFYLKVSIALVKSCFSRETNCSLFSRSFSGFEKADLEGEDTGMTVEGREGATETQRLQEGQETKFVKVWKESRVDGGGEGDTTVEKKVLLDT